MKLSLRDSMHQITDPKNLTASVREVFETMLGVQCDQESWKPSLPDSMATESVTAVVGFGGILGGACVLRCDAATSRRMAAFMTGTEFESVDEVVRDGMGEICNMIAGAWKSKIPELASRCVLSVPAVITGCDYRVHVQAPEFRLHQTYFFKEGSFEVMIICDSLQ